MSLDQVIDPAGGDRHADMLWMPQCLDPLPVYTWADIWRVTNQPSVRYPLLLQSEVRTTDVVRDSLAKRHSAHTGAQPVNGGLGRTDQ
ncbi:hypothetical protein GCM10022222_43700 [Amycolatopsis ultiminotia]|uniref:Uncharacterized protein n=1 Tax=Amycolatopsis ultiminotia TaxID=543629 RepID=A0ABP6WTJ3_9PSEU